MLDKDFIESAKRAVDELIGVVKTPIDYSMIRDEKEKKQALQTKKRALLQVKEIVSGVVGLDYRYKKWARGKLDDVVRAGEDAVQYIFNGLSSPIETGETPNYADLLNAIGAKTIAFNDSMELMRALEELREAVKTDSMLLSDDGFEVGYAERYALGMKPSRAGVAEDGVIVIDPDGGRGEEVECYGIRIALPPEPKTERGMYNTRHKNPLEDVWERGEVPVGFSEGSAVKYEKYIGDEFERRRRGVWFWNKGEREYITGAHWFLLQHCRTEADGAFFFFTKMQQRLFWFMEAVFVDERCYGLILEKIRRGGFTHCFLAFMLCKTTMYSDKLSGMTSKTSDDASRNFDKLTKMYSSLPFYFKPTSTRVRPKTSLEFSPPSTQTKKGEREKTSRDSMYLNSVIDYEATKEDSYDGTALFIYIADEFSKWVRSAGNILTHYEMVKKCVTKGRRITGKIFIISTIENVTGREATDDEAGSGDRYRHLYFASDPDERDRNGRTETGLYKLFISVNEHFEGFIDRWGYCVVETPDSPIPSVTGGEITMGVREFMDNELMMMRGSLRAMREYLRKTPREERDGFAVAEGACAFNEAHITHQIAFNEACETPLYVVGNFEWVGEKDSGEVKFIRGDDGRFKVSWLPESPNNVKLVGGVLTPMNGSVGAFGIDPYRVSKTTEANKGSKGSIHGFSVVNTIGAPDNCFFLEYLNRPATKEIFFDDCIMAMVYYGMPALVENNVNNLLDEMYRRGYTRFSIRRPDKRRREMSEDEVKYGGIPTTGENVSQMMSSALEDFIEYHVWEGGMCFNNTLQDWLVFDERQRTKRDASISSSLALLAVKGIRREVMDSKNMKVVERVGKVFLPKFNNKGVYTI